MEKIISIAQDKLQELYKILTHYPCIAKEQVDYEMCKVFGKRTLKKPIDVTERVKTFEDACHELGDNHYLVRQYCSISQKDTTLDAFLKLRIICAALNEGWRPEYGYNEAIFYPMFDGLKENKIGSICINRGKYHFFRFWKSDDSPTVPSMHYSSTLYLKCRELSDYCGEQFKEIWSDYLLGQ